MNMDVQISLQVTAFNSETFIYCHRSFLTSFLYVHLFFFFFFIHLFIYFWLCGVFVSVRGLSLVAASGGHSSSWCTGLSLSRPLLLQGTGFQSRHISHPHQSRGCFLTLPTSSILYSNQNFSLAILQADSSLSQNETQYQLWYLTIVLGCQNIKYMTLIGDGQPTKPTLL